MGLQESRIGWGSGRLRRRPTGCRLHWRRGGPWLRCSCRSRRVLCEGSGVVGFGDVAYADFRPGPFAGVGDVLGNGCAVSSSRVIDDGQFGHVVSPLWWVVGVSLVVGRRLVAPCGGKHPAGADGDGDISVCSAGEASTGAVLSLLYRIQGRFFLVRGGVQAPRMLREPVRVGRWSGSE